MRTPPLPDRSPSPRSRRRPLALATAGALCGLAVATLALASAPVPASAQSVLARSPNLSGAWVGPPGTLHFNFLHRFDAGDAPVRKLSNVPTFLLGWGIGGYALVGAHYVTASDLEPGYPNEWELLVRFSPLSTQVGALFDLGLTAAWNEAARSLDGELSLGAPVGPGKLTGALRALSDGFGQEDARWVVGVGGVLPLGEHAALAGDVVRPFDLGDDEALGWGAALQLEVPYTPHTLSLQATNTNSATLQGSSRRAGGTRWGFEYTIPIDPGRYFGEGAGTATVDPDRRLGQVDLVAGDTARIAITDAGYGDTRVVVRPGTYVVWTNESEAIHSVTADSGAWESPLIAPGESFGRVFTEEGEHPYHSSMDPSLTGLLVVRAAGAGGAVEAGTGRRAGQAPRTEAKLAGR